MLAHANLRVFVIGKFFRRSPCPMPSVIIYACRSILGPHPGRGVPSSLAPALQTPPESGGPAAGRPACPCVVTAASARGQPGGHQWRVGNYAEIAAAVPGTPAGPGWRRPRPRPRQTTDAEFGVERRPVAPCCSCRWTFPEKEGSAWSQSIGSSLRGQCSRYRKKRQ